ncbi:MAG: hypothetical protein KGI54_10420 [Pseudomonadota bacterium]|nr:hypothetical protein [Pseudomonadota bacterium]
MANNFRIVISATDRATASIKKINNSMGRITRPIAEIGRSVKALGREIGRNPIIRLGKGIARVGIHAVHAGKQFAGFVLKITGLVGGAIAGVLSLATSWAKLGWEISRTSAILGISTFNLQSLRGAAQLAGVSSENLTSSMQTLGNTFEDAFAGRNQEALAVLNRLHIGIHRLKDGSIDSKRALLDLSRAIHGIHNAEVQQKVASIFGVSGILPMLQGGPDAIKKNQQKAVFYGAVPSDAQIARAKAFGEVWASLKMATEGLRISIGDKLIPVFMPLLQQLTKWIAKNRELISTKIGNFIKGIATWLEKLDFKKIGSYLKSFTTYVEKATDKLSGMLTVFNALAAVIHLPRTIGTSVYDWLHKGPSGPYNGITQNNPGNLREWGNTPTIHGFANFATPTAGLRAMVDQLKLYGQRGKNTLSSIVNTYAPAADGNNDPAYIADLVKRTGFGANQHLNLNDPKVMTSLVSSMIYHEQGKNPYGAMVPQAVKHELEVRVVAAAGTKATVATKSPSIKVRVEHSLPHGVS